MESSYFDYLVKEKLPILEVSVFGEEAILPYRERKGTYIIPNDLNNLTNEQILSIIKDRSVSLGYSYFSLSIFQLYQDKIVFFTQKCKGIKSSLSQIFLNDQPILMVETKFLNLLEILIEEFKKKCRTDLSNLVNEFSSNEYR